MSIYYYFDLPLHFMEQFRAVREAHDNLWNALVLIEAINSCPEKRVESSDDGFDVAIFTKSFDRFLIKKADGYFSMSNPFQVLLGDGEISFNCDLLEEPVSGKFISVMRNIIQTVRESNFFHDDVVLSLNENFDMSFTEAATYADTYSVLVSNDHGYFRFDDDLENENENIHPRYHFDIFFKNSSSIKIGYDRIAGVECFLSLVDKSYPKKYLLNKS